MFQFLNAPSLMGQSKSSKILLLYTFEKNCTFPILYGFVNNPILWVFLSLLAVQHSWDVFASNQQHVWSFLLRKGMIFHHRTNPLSESLYIVCFESDSTFPDSPTIPLMLIKRVSPWARIFQQKKPIKPQSPSIIHCSLNLRRQRLQSPQRYTKWWIKIPLSM